jgi:hypothetical protein
MASDIEKVWTRAIGARHKVVKTEPRFLPVDGEGRHPRIDVGFED